jgi:hypothetical protein
MHMIMRTARPNSMRCYPHQLSGRSEEILPPQLFSGMPTLSTITLNHNVEAPHHVSRPASPSPSMTTRRHQLSDERYQQKLADLTRSTIDDLQATFPNALCWVIFSAIGAQRADGIGSDSPRADAVAQQFDEFLKAPDTPPTETQDILCCNSITELEQRLPAFIEQQRWIGGPLCPWGDKVPNPEAMLAYEYFWTE